jgi:hypothetical protein
VFKGIGAQRLMALFAGGWLLFNYPLLGLWDRDLDWFGLPAFPTALFGLWALLIVAVALLVERLPAEPSDGLDTPVTVGASTSSATGATGAPDATAAAAATQAGREEPAPSPGGARAAPRGPGS